MSEPDELVGFWDSLLFEYGSMEAIQLALLADGTGWEVWANAAGSMALTLLEWRRTSENGFRITERLLISGGWEPDRPGCLLREAEPMPLDDRTDFLYELTTQLPPLGDEPVLALRLSTARTFGLARRDISPNDRPRVVDVWA